MKIILRRGHAPAFLVVSAVALLATGFSSDRSQAADRTWDGGGADNFWQTDANWDANTAPVAGDLLFFGGTTRLTTTNNFPAGTLFDGITFNNPAGAFTLNGSSISLGGDIANNMVVVTETINLPLALSATHNVFVVQDGFLSLGGVISGTGSGLVKTGGGQLTLNAANTFDGPITVSAGTIGIGVDSNLGAVPGSPTPSDIVLDSGALRTTSTLALNANRGIALGTTGTGRSGTFNVDSGTTLTYGGVMANNGAGTGGLTKSGFGGLTLSGANTYTGPTAVRNGTLTLDFTQPNSPLNDVINAGSALSLGGENAGLGARNFAALVMNGGTNADVQTFSGATVDIGAARIFATGNASLALGSLAHTPGGIVVLASPGTGATGSGDITTTTPNTHGILGGWATVGTGAENRGIATATDWATVDGTGRILAYAGYTIYPDAGVLHNLATADTNLRIDNTSAASVDVVVDIPAAGTTTDLNTINLHEARGLGIQIGAGNILRLGRFGGISKSDTATPTWAIGSSAGGANGVQDEGTLTAGGADDTPGEIVFTLNSSSQSTGSLNVEAMITDNGTAPVTVVKSGMSSMKFRGHNTYSGGTYILQGRFQLAGSEIGSGNPDGWGTGPVYIFPGGQAFPSGIGTGSPFTNDLFIAGIGTDQENTGAIRLGSGSSYTGTITLIGDARLGGGGSTAAAAGGATIAGKITGSHSLDIGATANVGGGHNVVILASQDNDWTGNTTILGRTGGSAGNARLMLGTNDVIPNGFGKGNVVIGFPGVTTSTSTLDLNGFDETINGLSSEGAANLPGVFVENNAATPATLIVGDNDQSATFGGIIRDGTGAVGALGAGAVNLTKIGGGRETLTGANTYTGATTVNGGVLGLSGGGSIANSQQVFVNSGATLDVSDTSGGFYTFGAVGISNGTMVVRTTDAASGGIAALSLTNATMQLTALGETNVVTGNLTTGGNTNIVSAVALGTVIPSYPAQFTVIKYTGAISGAGFNFGLGTLPGVNTKGFLSNNVVNSSVDLVLTDGPHPLTWSGVAGADWDIGTTTNWLTSTLTPSAYQDFDFVFFTDTAIGTTVNLAATLSPGSLTVSNLAQNYTLTGGGQLTGLFDLIKQGGARLTLANTGDNDFRGRIIVNDGTLAFDRTNNLTVSQEIAGSAAASVLKTNTNVLTLAAGNTFDSQLTVAQGTLKAGSAAALGTGVGSTTVNDGAGLDVNGQTLNTEPVTVSGAGADDKGAIANSGADNINALANVTLAGNTTFGGTGRWDIRDAGAGASLSTGGNAYKLTKTGTNQVSLVGVAVDAALDDIDVQQGTFSVETTTDSLGNPTRTLTVASGATLQLFNTVMLFDKVIVLNGNGVAVTVNNGAGANNLMGAVTLNGNCVVNAGGTSLTFNGPIGGSGGLTKTGGATLTLAGANTYTGDTVINGGTLALSGDAALASSPNITLVSGTTLDVSFRNDGTLTLASGQMLVGVGMVNGSLTANAGSITSPGANAIGALTVNGAVTLGGTARMNLSGAAGTNDAILSPFSITYGGILEVNNLGGALTNGATFKLFDAPSYGGSFSGIQPSTPGAGQTWDATQLAVDGTLRVVGEPAPTEPQIGTVTLANGDLVLSGAGGAPGGTYFVLTSTDVALPVTNWTRLTTNLFDNTGAFSVTNAVDPNAPQRFFLLGLP